MEECPPKGMSPASGTGSERAQGRERSRGDPSASQGPREPVLAAGHPTVAPAAGGGVHKRNVPFLRMRERSVPAHYLFLREDFRQIERRISRVSGARTPSRPLGATRGNSSWRGASPPAPGAPSPPGASAPPR